MKKTVTLNPGESKVVGFQFTPSVAKTHSVLVNGLAGSFNAIIEAPVGNWLLPTGHYDPDNDWEDGPLAYDGNTDTYAENWTSTLTWSAPLELTTAPIDISAIRCYISSPLSPKIADINAFYEGAWHNILSGSQAISAGKSNISSGWNEISIPAGAKVVTKASFRMYNRSYSRRMRFRLHEFEFFGY